MRLWHKDLIPVLPDKQLVSQWRECCAIAGNISRLGFPNHILVNRIMDYKLSHFYKYCELVVGEMHNRGYKITDSATDKIFSIADYNIRVEADVIVTKDDLFRGWHNNRYLMQCYYNLQEKYDCGGVKEADWQKIQEVVNE